MSIGGAVFTAGQYTVSWNSVALGIMEGDASVPTIQHQNKAEPLANTDKFGKSTLTAFYQGADWFAQFTCGEYKAGVITAWWPFGAMGVMGVVSRSYWDMAQFLVLTAVAGTPAATANNLNSLSAGEAILAPGYNTQILLGPTWRKVPIRQQLFPYDTGGGVYGWFSIT
jgi:hypothetical protein